MSHKVALVLSGGGARGAYQAGVLKGLSEILPDKKNSPFKIISGVSTGAINGAKLACDIDSFANAVEKLNFLWSQISTDQVFKSELLSVNRLSLGSFFAPSTKKFDSLLDTSPLSDFLNKHCEFSKIKKNLASGSLESLIITANNYNSGAAVSFVQTATNKIAWHESRRLAVLAEINSQHVMASAAIPMLFSPIKIGSQYYGDGCVRNSTPCSPSLRMGADKLFVIGVRTQMSTEITNRSNSDFESNPHPPSMIRILNTLLNAVLLDSVEQDVRRIQRINELLKNINTTDENKKNFQIIPSFCISPSENIGEIARSQAHHLPRLIRMSISAFGSLDEASEILSYLLFEPHFCRKLLEMGYHDALNSKKQIEEFFLNTD